VRVPNAQGLTRTTQFLMQEYTVWIELRETLAKFQAERGNETSGDKGSDDMKSKAERKRKSDASPVEFCRRSLAGGNLWDSLAVLQKIMKLRE